MDFVAIDNRLRDIEQTVHSTPFNRKCASLEETFKLFLASCPHSPTLMTALPDDVRRFLIWKDNPGKTKVHGTECQFVGEYGVTP